MKPRFSIEEREQSLTQLKFLDRKTSGTHGENVLTSFHGSFGWGMQEPAAAIRAKQIN
jgi:hypothetical protein